MFFCNCISCNQDWVSIKKVINSNFSQTSHGGFLMYQGEIPCLNGLLLARMEIKDEREVDVNF